MRTALLACACLLLACCREPGGASTPSLAGTSWRLMTLADAPALAGAVPTLAFGDAGGASGSTGCNSWSAAVALGARTVSFGPLATTRRLCEAAVADQEDRFVAALAAAATFGGGADELVLYGSDGAILARFVRAD